MWTRARTHPHAEDDTHLTRHILLLLGKEGWGWGWGVCDPAYSALLCLYDCVLHSGHMKETVCEKEEREKKKHTHIFTEHHCHCHWTASLKREGRSKASGAMASGGGGSPCRGGEGQTLRAHPPALPPHPPTAHTQPYLGFVHPRALKQTANFIS